MARRRQRWTLAALLLQPASGFYALSRHNLARTALRSSSDPAADDDTPVPVQKALAAMTAFSNRYVKVSGTKYCSEPSVPAVVIRGLAEHKAALGAPLCPCRNYVDKEAEAKSGYWNCPCVPMRGPAWKSTPSSRRRMEATSRRWRGSATPSSRCSYGEWGARNFMSTTQARAPRVPLHAVPARGARLRRGV